MTNQGRLEVITGPMFSGKSEELMRRLRREKLAGRSVGLFKPLIDDRYEEDHVVSHNGAKMEAIRCEIPGLFMYGMDYDVVGIDEIQFFPERVRTVLNILIWSRRKIIVAGLDMTFRQEPFGIMPYLLSVAEDVQKLSAVCHRCGNDAYFTQRLVDGEPASFSGATVEVGGTESYEARCRNCFESRP